MIIRFKKSWALFVLPFLAFTLLDYKLFYITELTAVLNSNSLTFITAMVGFLFMFIAYKMYYSYNGLIFSSILKRCIVVGLSWTILVFYSLIMYDQPILVTIVEHASLLYVFWTIPIVALMIEDNDIKNIYMLINFVVLIWFVVIIVQSFIWQESKALVLTGLSQETIRSRYHGFRIGLGSLGNIALIYNAYDFLYEANNNKSKFETLVSRLVLILGIYSLVFIQQTRAYTFAILISMGVMFFKSGKKMSFRSAFIFIIGVAAIVYFIFEGKIGDFFSSFKLTSSDGLGTSLRLSAIAYYFQCFMEKFPFGNGFANYAYYPSVEHGVSGTAYYSDVGIFGLLGETGIFSIVFFVIPVVHFARTVLIARRNEFKYTYLLEALLLYLLITSITLITTDTFRAWGFPVILATDYFLRIKMEY